MSLVWEPAHHGAEIWLRREKKVTEIVALLRRFDITRDMAERATEDQWKCIAWCAGVNTPSETTRQIVLAALGPAPRKPCAHEWPETRRAAHR